MKEVQLELQGLRCTPCVRSLERAQVPGPDQVEVAGYQARLAS